jgi:hypothetical protein
MFCTLLVVTGSVWFSVTVQVVLAAMVVLAASAFWDFSEPWVAICEMLTA